MRPPLRRCRVFPPCCAGGTAPVARPSPFHGSLGLKARAPNKVLVAHPLPPYQGVQASVDKPRKAVGRIPCLNRGFTLIELLVAISVMALLALLSWRSVDGMTQTQTLTQQRADELLRLQAAVGQWVADLDAVTDTQELKPLDFDGRVLRLTRRDAAESGLSSPGVRVVAWTQLNGQWRRWQSAPLRQRDELARAWQRAALWGQGQAPDPALGGAADSAVNVAAIDDWQLFYHRGETWANPLSAVGNEAPTGTPAPTPNNALPNGVRLVLTLSPKQALTGPLTRDWVRPTLEAGQ